MKHGLILLTGLFLLSSSAWSAGTLKVTTPNGGQKWTTGKSYAVKWSKGSAGATVKIQLLKSGKHYKWVSKKTKNDGKHTYKIPSTVVTSSAYKIKIVSIKNKKIFDTSNKTFKITKAASGGTFKVTTPNGGQKWTTGKSYQIKWSKGTAGAKVKIQLLKNGKAPKWISKSTANDGKYTWKIPSTVATASTYKVKITSTTKKTVTDSSNSNFKITKSKGGGGSSALYTISKDGSTVRCPTADSRSDYGDLGLIICQWMCGTYKGRTGIVTLAFRYESPSFYLASYSVNSYSCK